MKSETQVRILLAVVALTTSMLTGYAASQTTSNTLASNTLASNTLASNTLASNTLASPESFSAIGDTETRSAAMFAELGKVLVHPRCVNCHPAGDRPHQGIEGRLHQPPVQRG